MNRQHMIKKVFSLIFIMGFLVLSIKAQTISAEQYIALYKDIAIREMKRMGVPAAITLAQGILETESGNSVLVKKSNNHFGIKCKSTWTSGGVSHDDDAPGECFRVYKNAEDSYRDHSSFLRGGERYSFLFNINVTDYKGWAHGLKKAGYATNPKYPNILIKHIEQYNLQQYTLEGAGEVAKFESNKYKDDPVVFDKNESIQVDDQEKIKAKNKKFSQQKNDVLNSNADKQFNSIIQINGSKCLYVKKGTSLLAVATQNNISLHKLLDINELDEDGLLEEDQLIFIQKKAKVGDKDFVIVQRKERLYDLAQNNGIQLESLLQYNNLNKDGDILAGSKIYLKPVKEVAVLKITNKSAPANKTITYQVKPKEGLYTVAKKYNVTIKQLKEWNSLNNDDIKVGQQLIVGK